MPEMWSGQLAAMRQPLMFDPGEARGIRHQHRLGRAIGRRAQRAEARRLFAEYIFAPLGMKDAGSRIARTAGQASGGAPARRRRLADAAAFEELTPREFLAGGGGLYSTAGEYLAFLQALLQGGGASSGPRRSR